MVGNAVGSIKLDEISVWTQGDGGRPSDRRRDTNVMLARTEEEMTATGMYGRAQNILADVRKAKVNAQGLSIFIFDEEVRELPDAITSALDSAERLLEFVVKHLERD